MTGLTFVMALFLFLPASAQFTSTPLRIFFDQTEIESMSEEEAERLLALEEEDD